MGMVEEAINYALRNWYVFPCREKPGAPYVSKSGETLTPTEKMPYTGNGFHDATIDLDQIEAWWKKWPNAMIGISAGKSGLFVVDIDRKHVNGLETFATWNINDTAGLHSMTPSGGMHILFSGSGKTSTNASTGIDTRGEGGYFIAPPSVIIEGEYCGEYKEFDDWTKNPGVIPDGLMAKLFPDNTLEYVRGNNSSATEGEKKQLSRSTLNFLANGAMSGERNSTLFRVLADFAGCGYSMEHAKETVFPVSIRIGLNASEFEQVLLHAYSKPRTASIPDSIQEKINEGGKNLAGKITFEEQSVMEDALIACLLIDNSLIPIINDILNFEDFQNLKNRLIYKAVNRVHAMEMKVDHLTVSSEVEKESVNVSLTDISKMINDTFVNTDNAVTYAYIIKEKASIRKVEALMDNKEKYIKAGNLIEIVSSLEKDIVDIALYGGAKSSSVMSSEQAVEKVSEHTRKMANGEIEQLKIGFSDYDYHVGGLYANELVILAGRPGSGKSACSLSIANNIAIKDNKPVAMFSLEMSINETVCRLICQLTGLPFKNIFQGKLNADQWKIYKTAMEQISDSKLYFDDSFGITVPELRTKVRKLMDKDIKLVIIDQLEQVHGYKELATHLQYDKIAYDIKSMTKEFGVPIILNHQLNRGVTSDRKVKNPEPQLSDLNQAGEKPVDQAWFIAHNYDEKGAILQSKIKVLKNRNGMIMEFPVIFLGERMLFGNPVREEDKFAFQSGSNRDYDDYDEPKFVRED